MWATPPPGADHAKTFYRESEVPVIGVEGEPP